MNLVAVNTENAPATHGDYSQAVIHNGQVYLSGQLGVTPETGEFEHTDTKGQTRQALLNLEAILQACGSDLTKILTIDIYLKKMDDLKFFNDEYNNFFPIHKPARSVIEVSNLPKDGLIEIKCMALK